MTSKFTSSKGEDLGPGLEVAWVGPCPCPQLSHTLETIILENQPHMVFSTVGTVYGACLLLHACRINQCGRDPGIPLYLFPHG